MNFKVISRNVGKALLVNALFMFLSVLMSIYDGFDEGFISLDFTNIAEIAVKRMYGNATFDLYPKEGKRQVIMRLSFAAANVADSGADFINGIIENGYSDELFYHTLSDLRVKLFECKFVLLFVWSLTMPAYFIFHK